MHSYTCKNCGFLSKRPNQDHICPVCGAIMAKKLSLEDQRLLNSAFQMLGESRFDKAKTAFEAIILKYPDHAKAYWGRLRARYHIDYELTSDGSTVPRSPTRSVTHILEDADYLKAIELADDEEKSFMQVQMEYLKSACFPSGPSKNLTQTFAMGEVDPNDELKTEPNAKPKQSKKPILISAVLSLILLLAVGIGLLAGLSGGYTLEFSENADGTYRVTGIEIKNNASCQVEIPSVYRDKPVTSIGSSAFRYCTGITGITVPDSVTNIGHAAFDGCNGLETITLPFVGNTLNGTSNTHFGYIFGAEEATNQSMYIPESLKTVVITGCTTIEASMFSGCTGLTSISIPNSVTSISAGAFADCGNLEQITLPFIGSARNKNPYFGYIFGAENISDQSRYIPASLKTVIILDGTSIASGAFKSCFSLTSVTLPETVTNINPSAFDRCTALTDITIPDSVTSIGYAAFRDCSNLTSIIFDGTVAQWEAISFGSAWDSDTGEYTVTCTDGTLSK